MSNIVWERRTPRLIVQVITTSNWKSGIPINQNIRKYLVKLIDLVTQDNYVPTDEEFPLMKSMYDRHSLNMIREAFEFKEEHNVRNLKNPELRKIERLFGNLFSMVRGPKK
jgi:hypothetical protein